MFTTECKDVSDTVILEEIGCLDPEVYKLGNREYSPMTGI